METSNAAKPMQTTDYLRGAVQKIYNHDDDFVLLGLTGRTGSGCSTVAKILQSRVEDIRHSLFSGADPTSNEQRKERLIYRYFKENWEPFLLIRVRSILTTFLLRHEAEDAALFIENVLVEVPRLAETLSTLRQAREIHLQAIRENSDTDPIQYYTETLAICGEQLKEILGESSFVKLYQVIGRNVRHSGSALDERLVEGKFFTLIEEVNLVIRLMHKHRMDQGKRTFIVVDAIRNPLEAIFFQDRYTSFFLMAVSSPDDDRLKRLRQLRYTEDDIRLIDKTENTSHQLGQTDFYTVQDIPACLQRADLYISNPEVKSAVNRFQYLANQLVRFVSLIRRPGIITPTAIERCMQIAYTAKLNSGCISRQVGAVVTDRDFSVRSVGWNDAPFGQVPCNLRNRDDLLHGRDSLAYSEFERTDEEFIGRFKTSSARFEIVPLGGRNNAFCFKSEYNSYKKDGNQVHTRSLHAEENAFLQVAKYGLASIAGGILFTTASPCELCAKKAYQLGIERIYYIDPYPGIAVRHILRGGARNPDLLLFSGAIGRAFHRLYTPIVAYKDELNALVRSH
jgi:deoxycytidylate deaminase